MANLSKQKREEFVRKIEELKTKEKLEDADRLFLNDIINELNEKKYGLIWEQHSEAVDKMIINYIPVFTEDTDRKIITDLELPYNFLLEGDNLHSLKLLEKTHKGRIDVIYIDPPYNTGKKDFTYDDKMIGEDDGYRHSKWLSFMNERLQIAYELLSEDGLIFISIDDNEQAQLKILCDDVFSEENFIANLIWAKNSGNNNSINVSIKTEYVLVYARNKEQLDKSYFSKRKESFDDIFAIVTECRDKGMSPEETQDKLRKYYSNNKNISNGTKQYKYIDDEYRIFRISDLGNPSDTAYQKSEYTYDYINPLTGKKCTMPKRGWLYKKEELEKKISENMIYFNSEVPQLKRYLDSVEYENISSLLINNDLGNRDLENVIDEKSAFTYPKPISLIKTCISCNPKNNITVLDFFAGSGTTGQAVMELNKEDGGNRKFILCTNNEIDSNKSIELMISKYGKKPTMKKADYNKLSDEDKKNFDKQVEDWEEKYQKLLSTDECQDLGICKSITYQRLKTVITGTRTNGSKYADGIPANLKYYKTDFVSKISDDDNYFIEDELTKHIKEMIELENAVEIDNDRYVLILSDEEADAFEKEMKEKNLEKIYIDSTIMLSKKVQLYLDNNEVYVIPIPDYYFAKDIK